MKKQLIKEVDINGDGWYWTELNGEKVTPYRFTLEQALADFKDFKPVSKSITVIKEEEI